MGEIRGILTGFAVVATGLLIAVSVSVGIPGQELLTTLRFHIGALFLLLPVALFMAGARWRAIGMLALVLLSLGEGASIVLSQQSRRAAFDNIQPAASLRVLNFNVLASNARSDDAAQYIRESGADVVVIMETAGVAAHLDELAVVYPHQLGCTPPANCDLVMISRTPFIDPHVYQLNELNRWRFIVAGVEKDGRPVTIAGIHLTKPYFDWAAGIELFQLRQTLAPIEGPIVVTGDFNAAAWSDRVAYTAEVLELVPPPFYPATWPVRLGPLGVPIDNMFTRGPARISAIAPTPESFGSNHLGLLATIELF